MKLRDYQQSIFNQVVGSQANDLVQLDTGAGKTPVIAKLAEYYGHAVIVCHRNILIKQASEKLAMCGLTHKVVASRSTKKVCANNNITKVGKHYLNPRSNIELVSIDTINSQLKNGRLFINKQTKILLVDEAHHLAEDNKWAMLAGKLNIRCVGFTATPVRGDGQPMLTCFGGFFNRIIQADGYKNNATETLISQGWLAEYAAYYCEPAARIEDKHGNIKLTKDDLCDASALQNSRKLALGNDALKTVLEKCKSRQTLVVFPRIEVADYFCEQAHKAKHNAQAIHSQLPQYEIQRILEAFERGDVKTLVSVDMVNEGFDLPAVDALVLCRDVRSFGFYRQICGRVLRPSPNKLAVIYDLTGCCIPRHGLPSDAIDWTKAQASQVRKDLMICPHCKAYIKRNNSKCPRCNKILPVNDHRSSVGAGMTIEQYIAQMQRAYRQQVSEIERKKLKQKQADLAKKAHEETYIDHSVYFSNTLIGKRCSEFFNALKQELKFLSCAEYNDFFTKHQENFNNIAFYLGTITTDFECDKSAQCKQLYEKHK